jgi:arsenic resistance protein ArsH
MSRLRDLSDPDHLPALDARYASARPATGLGADEPPPRILLLYGSLRDRSYSRLCVTARRVGNIPAQPRALRAPVTPN